MESLLDTLKQYTASTERMCTELHLTSWERQLAEETYLFSSESYNCDVSTILEHLSRHSHCESPLPELAEVPIVVEKQRELADPLSQVAAIHPQDEHFPYYTSWEDDWFTIGNERDSYESTSEPTDQPNLEANAMAIPSIHNDYFSEGRFTLDVEVDPFEEPVITPTVDNLDEDLSLEDLFLSESLLKEPQLTSPIVFDEMAIPSPCVDIFDPMIEDEIHAFLIADWDDNMFTTVGELDPEAVIKELEDLLYSEENHDVITTPLPIFNEDCPDNLRSSMQPCYRFSGESMFSFPFYFSNLFSLFFLNFIFTVFNHSFLATCLDTARLKCGKGDFDIPFDNG